MDVELLNALGIDPKKDLKELIEALEDKQGEFFERLETVSDEARRDELSELLSQIDAQIAQLKAQLKAMSSGIVIDAGAASAASEEAAKKEAEKREAEKKEAEKAKKAAEAQKIQELKKREAERRKQADQAAAAAAAAQSAAAAAAAQSAASQQGTSQQPASGQKAAANKQPAGNSQAAASNNAQPAGNAQNGPKDLQQGLVLYAKKNFTGAFAIFKPLAEKGDATAQYMLGSMYHRGESTPKDEDRAKFWMKKAADAGDVNAQYDYAVMLLSDTNNQDLTMGLHYLGLAADQDHKDALLKYVDLAQNSDELFELQDAVRYCKQLIATAEDSFDKQKHTTTLNHLTAKLKVAQKQENVVNRASKLTTIGAIISIISIVSIFLGTHQQYLMDTTFLGSFPRGLREFLFSGWMDITASGGSASAVGLVLLGWMFRTAGNHPSRNAKAAAMEAVCVAFRYIAVAGHILFSILAGTKLFGNFFASAITIAMGLLIGKFIGWLLGKILKTR